MHLKLLFAIMVAILSRGRWVKLPLQVRAWIRNYIQHKIIAAYNNLNMLYSSICYAGELGCKWSISFIQINNTDSVCNRPIPQIPQCIRHISHNATEIGTFLVEILHSGIWDWHIMGLVQQLYCWIVTYWYLACELVGVFVVAQQD